MNNKSPLQQQLEDSLSFNDIPAGTPMFQRMKRSMQQDDKKEYAGLNTDKQRLAFRVAWAKRTLSKITSNKSHSQEWKQVDKDIGTYRTFERVAVEYGAAVDMGKSIKSAKTYCNKAAKLGGNWSKWCDMSYQWLFLFVEHTYEQICTECWATNEKHHEDKSSGPHPTSPSKAPPAINNICSVFTSINF